MNNAGSVYHSSMTRSGLIVGTDYLSNCDSLPFPLVSSAAVGLYKPDETIGDPNRPGWSQKSPLCL